MKSFVLDTSVALAWCFEDEQSPVADRILDLLSSDEAVVPAIWPVELGNALLMGERRKRITPAGISRSLELVRQLNIRLEDAHSRTNVSGLISLAREQHLTVYDATYLALAMGEGVPLATLDRALADAARSCGIRMMAG